MRYAALAVITAIAVLLGCATTQPATESATIAGVVLKDTYLYPKPGGGDPEGKIKVSRGEGITLKQAAKDQPKGWIQVVLSDKESSGWMNEKYLHKGPKIAITLTQNSSLYVRPDADSKILTTLPSGTQLLVLKQMEEWRKVSVDYDKDGWINSSSFVSGTK